jgi:transcriptional regulator with XRE-family HTH domain
MRPEELYLERQKIGTTLKIQRTQKNINRKQMHEISGLNPMTIDIIESGRNSYNMDSYIILKNAIERAEPKEPFIKKTRRSKIQYE